MTAGAAQARCVAVLEDDGLFRDTTITALAAAAAFTGAEGQVLLVPGPLPTLLVGCGQTTQLAAVSDLGYVARSALPLQFVD